MLPFRGNERCVVCCSHDRDGLWAELQSVVAAAVSPLRDVPLATRFGDVPTRLPRWGIPYGNQVAQQVVLQVKPSDETVATCSACDTANAFASPYCHLGFVRHDATDAAKEGLLAWAAEREERGEQHMLVVVGTSSGGTGLLSRALSFKGGEDMLTKLSKLGAAATCRLDAPVPSAAQCEEFATKLQECVRVSLSTRVDALIDELEAHEEAAEAGAEAEAGTAAEAVSFYRYFSLKEGLALLYQQTGMPSLALSIYNDLEEEFDAFCSDRSDNALAVPLLGEIEGAPVGTSAAKAAALLEAAVETAADQVLEDLLDGSARNYREDVRKGELGRVEMLQYIWWRRWQIILDSVGVGGGGDLNDALEVASGAIEKIRAILRDPKATVAQLEIAIDSDRPDALRGPDSSGTTAKLPEGYADRWAVCAALATGAQIAAQLQGGLGAESYRLVQPTLPLALGRLGSLYMAAHPIALRLAVSCQNPMVTETTGPSRASSNEEYTLQPAGEGTPAEMVANACQNAEAAAALGRALLRSALAAMRGAGRQRSSLQLARELAKMYCADGRHADASVLMAEQCGGQGCEQLRSWPLLRCDALRLLAVCHRNTVVTAAASGDEGGDPSREQLVQQAQQRLATCLIPLLGMETVVAENERTAVREELAELSVTSTIAIDVELDSSTVQVLLKTPISLVQQVSTAADGSVTIQLGRLALHCASPEALSPEAAAEAFALSAASGRRLSIGRSPPPMAAALAQTRSSGQEGQEPRTENRGGETEPELSSGGETGDQPRPEIRAVVVNVSTRLERTFVLDGSIAGGGNANGPTVGSLRAAIAAGDFGGATPAGLATDQTHKDGRRFELVVGTDPPLSDDTPLIQVACQGIILLIPIT